MKPMTLLSGMWMALACASLHAQDLNMHASIPFEFRVGHNVMPPGEYEVVQGIGFISMKSSDGRKSAFALTQGTSIPGRSSGAGLQFRQYGTKRFLAKLWIGADYIRELPRSGTEKTVAASVTRPENVVVALQSK